MAYCGACPKCGLVLRHPDSEAIIKMAMLSHVSRTVGCEISLPQELDAMVTEVA